MPRIAAVVLAAGSSVRFGAHKLLQPFRGKALIRHAVETALNSHAAPLLVVAGDHNVALKAALDAMPVGIVHNPAPSEGLSSSLKLGLRNLPEDCDGAIILLGDMPLLKPAVLNGLIVMFSPAEQREIGVPRQAGRWGNPVLWGRRFFPEILELTGDKGAKALMAQHRNFVYELEVDDPGIHIDIDTPEDLARYE